MLVKHRTTILEIKNEGNSSALLGETGNIYEVIINTN